MQQSDETALLAEARELCDMMPLVNHSMFLPHVMGLGSFYPTSPIKDSSLSSGHDIGLVAAPKHKRSY